MPLEDNKNQIKIIKSHEQSNVSYIYIRGEYAWITDILEQAIAEAKQNGWLGKNILGTDFSHDCYVQVGGGAYI